MLTNAGIKLHIYNVILPEFFVLASLQQFHYNTFGAMTVPLPTHKGRQKLPTMKYVKIRSSLSVINVNSYFLRNIALTIYLLENCA